jgi:tetratricopeptide (TPR) repeat protein
VLTDSGIAEAFTEIFDDFRGGYVLRYAPQGVKREGWHDITVRLPARPDLTVRARRGYAVEEVRTATATRPGTPSPGLAALDELAETFVNRDRRAFYDAWQRIPDARQALRDYVARPPIWPAAPRLESAFVLSLVEAPLVTGDTRTREEALNVLRREHDLLRPPLGADEFECQWYRTEMAVLQASPDPAEAMTTIRQALTRCPGDPRLMLGLAVTSDLVWSRIRSVTAVQALTERDVVTFFETAMTFSQTAGEAGVRLAFLAYRQGQLDEALRRLAWADAQPADGFVRYLRHFIRARVLQKQGRIDEAIDQFRAALVAWPRAHSARVGLMGALMIRGDRVEAASLSEAIQTATVADIDPFSLYWLGDYRVVERLQARLRELAR